MPDTSPKLTVTRTVAGTCNGGPCPHVYDLSDGDFLFQGDEVTDPAVLAGIEVSPGERFVRLPRDIVMQLVRRYAGEALAEDTETEVLA